MIYADFTSAGERLSLTVCGHAGYSYCGPDIVCAAISGIFYALIGYLKNECKELLINTLSAGEADIECSSDGIAAMRQAYIGFLQIAMSYPGTVSVREELWSRMDEV